MPNYPRSKGKDVGETGMLMAQKIRGKMPTCTVTQVQRESTCTNLSDMLGVE